MAKKKAVEGVASEYVTESGDSSTYDGSLETKATKRSTPKRWLEDHGFGMFWATLRPADRETIQRYYLAPTLEDAADFKRICEEEASALMAQAADKATVAKVAHDALSAVLARCEALKKAIES